MIINKIAAKSQSPAIVIGSDPKDDVTRWLCKFSRKFDGMKALRNWITFATDQIDKQKARVSVVGGECHGVPELLFAQDEVDSVFLNRIVLFTGLKMRKSGSVLLDFGIRHKRILSFRNMQVPVKIKQSNPGLDPHLFPN